MSKMSQAEFLAHYRDHVDEIYSYILVQTRDADLAKDLTSETFFNAQAKIDGFTWRGSGIGAWFFRIAQNQVRQHYRKDARMVRSELEKLENVPSPAPDILEQMVEDEERAAIFEFVMQMDDDTRQVIYLFYWQELKTREVSEILDVPEGTIKARLARGREKLRPMIDKLYSDGSERELPRGRGQSSATDKTDQPSDEKPSKPDEPDENDSQAEAGN